MAVSIQETVFNHVANGVTVDFAYGCQILAASDLIVFVDDVQVTTGFTVNGVGASPGGSVAFTVAPANGKKIRLERIIKLERTTNYQQSGDFLSRIVNPDFDRLWMALQQLETVLGLQPGSLARSLQLGRGDTNGAGAYRALQNRIQDLADPVELQDAANKRWILAQLGSLATDGSGQFVLDLLNGNFAAAYTRFGAGVQAVGRNANNLGKGLQIGGGDVAYGTDGTLLAPDGHASWMRFQPSKNESPIEVNIYPSASQGRATATNGTSTVTRVTGTPFSAAWIGKKIYFGPAVYRVLTVPDANTMTVSNVLGGTVPFTSTFTETFHVAYFSGTGQCQVTGGVVTRIGGDPFIPFVTAPYVFKLNGVTYAVTVFTDISTQTISAPPANGIYTYTFETDINDQLSTIRLQKLVGADEENLSMYSNYYGYHIRSFYAGSGQERPIQFGMATKNHLTLQTNGDVSLGGDYTYEAIRILYSAAGVNRFETTPAPAGFGPSWRSRGADVNIPMALDTKGAGVFTFTNRSFGNTAFQIFATAGTSWLSADGSTTDTPTFAANGTANPSVKLIGKGSGGVILADGGGAVKFSVNTTGIGFFAAPVIAKQNIVGSRGANAALASLLTGLANYGLITDSTTV